MKKKEIEEFVRKWIIKAENDIKVANQLIETDEIITEAVCFHCQQAVEKYLKAFLIYHEVKFPKTHDISFLIEKCKTIDKDFDMLYEYDADFLTEFGVEIRYPDEFYIPSEDEAKRCLNIALKVRRFVRDKIGHN